MKRVKKKNGISLIAVIITIVIMLILATVTIGTINGGLFNYARKAKKDTAAATIEEMIKESYTIAKSESKNGEITTLDFQNALDIVFGENGAEAIDNEGGITLRIDDKFYDMGRDGSMGEGKTINKITNAGNIAKTRYRYRS